MFMIERPRIGITMRLETESRRFYLGRDYSEAIEAAGGVPVHIALIPDRDYIAGVLEGIDGVLLPGSDTDPDPAYYNEEPHPNLKRVVPEKDQTDLLVLEEAEKLGIPLLAICFGMQILNVFRGGSLIQDIGSQVGDAIKHEQGYPLERNSHGIRIEQGSLLAPASFSGRADGVVRVNSHHHQAIRDLGRDLRVAATASDGVIEAVEDVRDDRFVLGVQWHPELSWRTDELSGAIFEIFAAKCKERRVQS
jgi:putative glutamine amidotransferase